MKLSAELAYRTIDLVYAESGLKAVVCDTDGMIIAAVEKDRIGTVHSGACRILQEGVEEVTATPEEETLSGGMVRSGVHLPIKIGQAVVGTYGIGGEPSMVRSIARISVGLIREDLHKQQIRRQMQEQDRRFQTLFASMNEGVALHEVVVDEAGVPQNYRIVEVNRSYERNVGLQKEAVCGKLANEAYGTPEPPFFEKFAAVGITGVADSLDAFFEPLNKYFSISIVPWGQNRFATIFYDVSERKRLEQELQKHSSALEATVERRTQDLFAANQELTAMNEEMTAMNEELAAMNETLEGTNRSLTAEVERRQKKEQEVVRRERQYQAISKLVKQPAAEIADFLEMILREAIGLVGAPGGYIGLIDATGEKCVICHTAGVSRMLHQDEWSTDKGILGEVCRSGEQRFVEDYRIYPHRITERSMVEKLSTVLMTPLKQGETIKGVLAANWQDTAHPATADELEIFRQFGNLASIAMERFHAGEKIGRQKLLLEKLAESTAALVNELDMEKVFQIIMQQATSIIGMKHGFIDFFEPDGEHVTTKCGLGRFEHRVGKTLFFGKRGLLAEVLRTGKLVAVEDYANWPLRLDYSLQDDLRSAIQAPLIVDGKIIGSIGFASYGEKIAIDQDMLAVLEQFATVAAIAVKNAMAHQQTFYQAYHDVLTGLPNRAHLNKRLEEELQQARSGKSAGAVMFIDLDDLKVVNDHFGHTSGDGVIIAAGQDIVRAAGEGAFVARVGGDEFVVILPGEADLRRISDAANRLVGGIRREFEVGGQTIQMTSSLGVTLYPADGDQTEEILKQADVAMYAAKANGKNCWRLYEPELTKDAYNRMVLTNSLRRALENDELCLHYQSLIAVDNKSVAGFEALLRWNSPQHGNVPPDLFIPLAEQSGIILPLGEWVIGEACRFARALSELGRSEVYVAVNVSPRQLAAEGFVEIVRQSIEEAGIAPSQIEIEITENVLIESLENSKQSLAALNSLGVRLALDDFGTGFSSLTYLRNLPVKTLKIDKSFTARILEDRVQEGFIRSIIDMAHVLSLHVVAEGVETEAQLAKLEQIHCDVVQGYVFSKPVAREEALQLLTR